MRLATWNVNSVRARLPRLLDWLSRSAPDVVCLQETKATESDFPYDELEWAGYTTAHLSAGRWNGVAIASRVGLDDVVGDWPAGTEPDWPDDAVPDYGRLLLATAGGLRIGSVYVPNGRTVDSVHYRYKLAWLAGLHAVAAGELSRHAALVLAGDFNVAPDDGDVFDPAAFADSTHVTPPERSSIREFAHLGLRDLLRDRWADPEIYTYWDYRAGMFHKNLGMRIDLVLASAPVSERVAAVFVDRQARKGSAPSDHAPVVIDLDEARGDPELPMIPMPSLGRRVPSRPG